MGGGVRGETGGMRVREPIDRKLRVVLDRRADVRISKRISRFPMESWATFCKDEGAKG